MVTTIACGPAAAFAFTISVAEIEVAEFTTRLLTARGNGAKMVAVPVSG